MNETNITIVRFHRSVSFDPQIDDVGREESTMSRSALLLVQHMVRSTLGQLIVGPMERNITNDTAD